MCCTLAFTSVMSLVATNSVYRLDIRMPPGTLRKKSFNRAPSTWIPSSDKSTAVPMHCISGGELYIEQNDGSLAYGCQLLLCIPSLFCGWPTAERSQMCVDPLQKDVLEFPVRIHMYTIKHMIDEMSQPPKFYHYKSCVNRLMSFLCYYRWLVYSYNVSPMHTLISEYVHTVNSITS